jgi:hypothetical protein
VGSSPVRALRGRGSRDERARAPSQIEVTVLKAEGIVAKDRGGTSDPFCKLVLGHQQQKTKVIVMAAAAAMRPSAWPAFCVLIAPAAFPMDATLRAALASSRAAQRTRALYNCYAPPCSSAGAPRLSPRR